MLNIIKKGISAIAELAKDLHHSKCSVQPTQPICINPQDKIEKRDINEDGSIQGRLICTYHFPLSNISYFPEIPTVAIEGDGFQKVEIRIPADLFLEMAEKVKGFYKSKGVYK